MSPACLLFFLEGRRWEADIRRFELMLLEAVWSLPARVPPHERERGC